MMNRTPTKRKINFLNKSDASANPNKSTMKWTSTATGKVYNFTLQEMRSEEIKVRLAKSIYNLRDEVHLNGVTCVADILPSIKEAGKNTVPGYVVGNLKGKGKILSGLRRSHAVSLCEKAIFVFWHVEEMDIQDQLALANEADKQEKPSAADRVLSLRKREQAVNHTVDDEVLAKEWSVSERYIREIRRFMESVPDELYSLFPALQYISYSFLQKIIKHDYESIKLVIEDIKPLGNELGDSEAKASSRKLQSKILSALKAVKPREEVILPDEWMFKAKNGFVVTPAGKSKVRVTLDLNKVPAEIQEALYRVLKE